MSKIRGPLAVVLAAAIASGAVYQFVAPLEGVILRTYRDPIGRIAACVGHDDQTMTLGTRFTEAECQEIFDRDAERIAEAMVACTSGEVSRGEAIALFSLAFNIGPAAYCGSSLVKHLNAGDYVGACQALLAWRYAGGRPILLPRRQVELALCERG